MTATVVRFLALLTVAADLMFVGVLLLLLVGRVRGWSGRTEWLRGTVSRYSLVLAWLIALTATLGSLYYSEVANFIPCKLCWYQRIAMYPLAVILGIAAFKKDVSIRRYVLPLAVIGGAVSIYHYVIERFPDLAGSTCDPAAPCTILWVWEFRFISIPFQALSGFALIGALMFLLPRVGDEGRGPELDEERREDEAAATSTGELIHS